MRSKLIRRILLVGLLVLILQNVNFALVQAAGAISVSDTSGSPGSSITVSGSGFGASETGITVTYDGSSVATSITATSAGSWSTSFTIPASASGLHTIDAYGSVTTAATVDDIIFTVTAAISISQTSGAPGTSLTVTGSGFAASETGIRVTYDGNSVLSSITASSQGAWSSTFIVPASASGSHVIDAYGATSNVSDVTFTVSSTVSLSQTSGSPGTTITVTGSGFGPNEVGITVTYDGASVASGISANSQGGWSTTFLVPPSASGSHAIRAYGSSTSTNRDITFTSNPGISINQTTGAPGNSITITGAGFGVNETGITVSYDGATVASGIRANSQGSWNSSFVVPASASGSHIIHAYGSITSTAPDVSLTVGPGISLSQTSASPGSSITIKGSGFGTNETGITVTYDGATVASGVRANPQGAWNVSFVIPASPSGSHIVHAYGSTTLSTSTPDIAFAVSPGISTNPISGTPGNSITMSGSGFGVNESGITVTYDGAAVASGIRANAQGGWTSTFVVPASASGSHNIKAYGPVSLAATISDIDFTVSAGITVAQSSAAPGSSITVTGTGFSASESGIIVTYDDSPVASGIKANSQGGWTSTFVIPSSASGSHTIKARGAVTQASAVKEASIDITPGISVNPSSAYVGATVVITGSGFVPNSPLKFTYDDKEISTEGVATADATGGFSKSLIVPKSSTGSHTIKVVDSQKNETKVNLTMENTPPPVPNPSSPADGARVGFLGNISPSLKWSSVSDPSGVTYVLQVSATPDFSEVILEKTGISNNQYTLTASEALPRGEYYWRIRAIDGASNQGTWSQPQLLKSGLISPLILVIVLLILAAAALAAYFYLVRPAVRRRQVAAVPQTEVPQVVVTGEWRSLEPEGGARERPLPLRLALPQASKGTKVLSTEDQARLKVVADFAQSLPLVEPGYNVNWLTDLMETGMGLQTSALVYEQLLKGDLQIRYEPTWMRHPIYQDLRDLLEGQPTLDDLNTFIDSANRCASGAISLLQDIYHDTTAEITSGLLQRGGWSFISSVYSDSMSWFQGKSLRAPSEREYTTKRSGEELSLCGEETAISLAGSLIQAESEEEAQRLRDLHLRLRRSYRNSETAKEVAAMISQLEVQRSRLLNVFSQFGRLK